MPDAVRLIVGTLTRIPVPPPSRVDARVAGQAMVLAPVVAVVLAVVVGGVAQALASLLPGSASPLLVSALVVAALAYLTRGLHLDGLADTADALGSGRPAPQALEIARRSDIGPFGVVTIALVVLVQVAAYSGVVADGRAAVGLAIALGTSRLALVLGCTRGVPAARRDGLGATVAGTVPRPVAALAVLLWLAACGVAGALVEPTHSVAALAAATVGLGTAVVVLHTGVRRLGGITGDVLGATVELTCAATLVILALAP
jgi:adenosylcobinamide-GDP ribazoletransferase